MFVGATRHSDMCICIHMCKGRSANQTKTLSSRLLSFCQTCSTLMFPLHLVLRLSFLVNSHRHATVPSSDSRWPPANCHPIPKFSSSLTNSPRPSEPSYTGTRVHSRHGAVDDLFRQHSDSAVLRLASLATQQRCSRRSAGVRPPDAGVCLVS